jgi:L-fuconolactonase
VDATVCVQAADALEETEFLLAQAAHADGWRASSAGYRSPTPMPRRARSSASRRPARAARHPPLIHDEPDPDWVAQPRVLESLALLAARGSRSTSARSRRATSRTCRRSPSARPTSTS